MSTPGTHASGSLRPLQPLLSPDWYRLAHIKPRLRSGVLISRHQMRGETWFMLTDPVSGRHHRFNDLAYALIGACDGQTTIDALWSARVSALGDDAPTQADAIRVFAQAFAANLFTGDVTPDVAALARAHSRTTSRRDRGRLNPLSFRVPLWDPDLFLARHLHRVGWLFRPLSIGLLLATVLVGAALLALNAGSVARHAQQELGSGRMLMLMWLVYPVMKAVHEMAHAFAVKRHGGAVHEMGITLMLLTPVPYVDASASTAFPNKSKRITVAAAGIVVELLLASLALPLMLAAEPGLLKDAAFAVVFVGALSTLLVNGNPLMRFDGYHVLCDAVELPNLAARSNRWWFTQFKRQVLRLRQVQFGALSRHEQGWLWAYAPLALGFRLALMAVLVIAAAQWHAGAGLALLALVVWQMGAQPAWAALQWLRRSPELRGRRTGTTAATAALALAVLAAAVVVPLPQRTHAPGLVWLPDDALARTGSEGFVEELLVSDGQQVQVGTPIARLSNDPLELELTNADAEFERQHVERSLQFGTNARRTADADEALTRLANTRQRLRDRVQALTVRAGVAGRVAIDPARVRLGQMLPQGEVIAQVLPADAPLIRVLVHNQDIALVRERLLGIQVQLPQGGPRHSAALVQATPRASTALPTRALGDSAGGSIALDPADASGRTAREPLFQLDLKLAGGAPPSNDATASLRAPVGARVLVTFAHGSASALELGWRLLRQTFLRHIER
jgi:putative peptide zinc metalloprotease protein